MLGTARHHSLLLAPALVLALVLGLSASLASLTASAAAAVERLVLVGPTTVARGGTAALTATLRSTTGSPVGGQTVRLERADGAGGWLPVAGVGTDGDGEATFAPTVGQTTTFRAVRDQVGDGSGEGARLVSDPIVVKVVDAATALALTVPAEAYVDSTRTVSAILTRTDTDAPVEGQVVRLQRRTGGEWRTVGPATTDSRGKAVWSVTIAPVDNTFRAVFAGRFDQPGETVNLAGVTSASATVAPRRRTTFLRLGGPDRVVDETSVVLRLTWRSGNGTPVPGTVTVQRRLPGGDWQRYTSVALGDDGEGSLRVRPRVDTRWRATGPGGRWWLGDTSDVHVLDNVPPTAPVAYPAGAPQPAISLPKQPRATGAGARATVGRIPDAMWRSMVGRSWHSGCPVGRASLRVVRVNYWGFDGYRYRGELVVRDAIAGKTARVFTAIYRARLPVRRMYRVDRFGWSSKLQGADDYRSMRADNTSAFNCRGVVGNPSVPSPHSYGRAIDVNPWENPYRSRTGVVPNSWWLSRSHPRIAWRSRSHAMVRIMAAHGFRWTYGLGDIHHFDG